MEKEVFRVGDLVKKINVLAYKSYVGIVIRNEGISRFFSVYKEGEIILRIRWFSGKGRLGQLPFKTKEYDWELRKISK